MAAAAARAQARARSAEARRRVRRQRGAPPLPQAPGAKAASAATAAARRRRRYRRPATTGTRLRPPVSPFVARITLTEDVGKPVVGFGGKKRPMRVTQRTRLPDIGPNTPTTFLELVDKSETTREIVKDDYLSGKTLVRDNSTLRPHQGGLPPSCSSRRQVGHVHSRIRYGTVVSLRARPIGKSTSHGSSRTRSKSSCGAVNLRRCRVMCTSSATTWCPCGPWLRKRTNARGHARHRCSGCKFTASSSTAGLGAVCMHTAQWRGHGRDELSVHSKVHY